MNPNPPADPTNLTEDPREDPVVQVKKKLAENYRGYRRDNPAKWREIARREKADRDWKKASHPCGECEGFGEGRNGRPCQKCQGRGRIPNARKICIFGGSFDPIHEGHLEILRQAITQTGMNEILVTPCAVSPHKAGSQPAPNEIRLEMVKQAIQEIPEARAFDFDLNRPQPAYGIETLLEVRRLHPHDELFWLIGADQWEALPRWHRSEELGKGVTFIVATRNQQSANDREGFRKIDIQCLHDASSTAIRNQIRSGQLLSDLHPTTAELIRQYRLYL